MPDLRESISTSLAAIETAPLRTAAIGLLSTLGYGSELESNDVCVRDPKFVCREILLSDDELGGGADLFTD